MRLERGSSIGEVARALEVNPNLLQRWRREIHKGPGNVFPGDGKQRWADAMEAPALRLCLCASRDVKFHPFGHLRKLDTEGPAIKPLCTL
jgi:transposase-like protein